MDLPKVKLPESFCKYRGVTPSQDITRFMKDSVEDIHTLFAILNENKEEIENIKNISNIENLFLFNKNQLLNTRIEELEKQLEELLGNQRTITMDAFNIIPDPLNACAISQEFNQLTVPIQKYVSKFYLYDSLSGKNIVPPSLSVTVEQTPEENQDIIITDNNLNYMVDGDSTTCWQRKIVAPKSLGIHEVTVEVRISIPYEIVSNRYINTISICPHPIQSVDILDIQYKHGDSYKRIPGFSEHSLYSSENGEDGILHARPVRFFFNDLEVSEIKVSLRQRTKVEEGDNDVFYIGAYFIDAGYTTFARDDGEFSATFTLSGINNTISNITAVIDNKTISGDSFQYEIYALNELDVPVFVSDKLPATIESNKIMVKGKIVKTTDVAPSIAKIRLLYQTNL